MIIKIILSSQRNYISDLIFFLIVNIYIYNYVIHIIYMIYVSSPIHIPCALSIINIYRYSIINIFTLLFLLFEIIIVLKIRNLHNRIQ